MNVPKIVLALCAAVMMSASLGGCVIVPVPYHWGPHHHDDRR